MSDPATPWLGPSSAEVKTLWADALWCARVVAAVRLAGRTTSSVGGAGGTSLIALFDRVGEGNKIPTILHTYIIREIVRAKAAGYADALVGQTANASGRASARPDLALRLPGATRRALPGEVKTASSTSSGFTSNEVYDKLGTGRRRLLIGVDFVKDVRPGNAVPRPDKFGRILPWMVRIGWVGADDYAGWSIRLMKAESYRFLVPLWIAPAAELPAILLHGLGPETLRALRLSPNAPISALPATFLAAKGLPAAGLITYGQVFRGHAKMSLPPGLLAARVYDRALVPIH
jgi:hypothetical protein